MTVALDRDEVVMSIWPFIQKQAAKISRDQADELAQVGVLRVLEKFDLYDPSFGVKPITYFGTVAVREMRDHHGESKVIRLPQYGSRQGSDTIRAAAEKAAAVASLHAPLGEDGQLADLLHDGRTAAPDEEAGAREDAERLAAGLRFLPERWQAVVRARFLEQRTLEDVAAAMGVTRERVRQVEVEALGRLRQFVPRQAPGGIRAPSWKARWRPDELAVARRVWTQVGVRELAGILGRPVSSCYDRLRREGCQDWPGRVRPWTAAEDAFLRDHAGESALWCATQLGRSLEGVYGRCKKLRIRRVRNLGAVDLALLQSLHAEGMPTGKIAERLGVACQSVHYRLHQLGLRGNGRDEPARAARARQTFRERYGPGGLGARRAEGVRRRVLSLGFGGLPSPAAVTLAALARVGGGRLADVAGEVRRLLAERRWRWFSGRERPVWSALRWLVRRRYAECEGEVYRLRSVGHLAVHAAQEGA